MAILGRDWTPEVLYYAHRRGWMLNGHTPPDVTTESLVQQGYIVYQCPWAGSGDRCVRIDPAALGVPVLDATIGPVTIRTGLVESMP